MSHRCAALDRFNDEVLRQGDVDVIDELLTEDFVNRTPPPGIGPDREGMKDFVRGLHAGIADPRLAIHDQFATDERVVERWTLTGTHAGEWLGIPATDATFSLTGIDVYRVEDGRLAELWCEVDMLGLLGQLGVIPAGEPVGEPS